MCDRARLQLLLSTGFLLQVTVCVVENNELVGPPNVNCKDGAIEMRFRTTKMFSGKVYVRGSYNRPECKVDYSSSPSKETQTGEIRIAHGLCNMDRQRMLSPDGVTFSIVLVISFHPLFITKFDKVYSIKCLYQEVTQTVATKLDVSMLPSEVVNYDVPVPSCSYTVRKDSLDGPILSYARVGDQVVHRWNCDSDIFGILVHSCTVEDGQGEKRFIVDENGCHTDRRLLGDPTYVEALNMAYRESYVFKFADRSALRFKCGIRLCYKMDGGCDGITPPLCYNETVARDTPLDLNISQHRKWRHRRTVSSLFEKEVDLLSQRLYILDNGSEDPAEFDQLSERKSSHLRTENF
ncbi:zona pellucida-like domain protein [Oesophagostomum dentatum]|uniref:Zona pellucida-like domain protein n=1 Tax=Oesophagostomum dentatum TaxID=61180 RepID=A0A0B1TKN3_OESDE|nr:zona pellucida-like domain protein [Oesophagostomum dentatum]